ncbi:hypothetical protein FQA47_004798 [Oryzias melastigma]|uniref:Uncharacterized protein n=1 Tax=Oryzias melastigma TaxID=30732 RepID=A0A834FE86_ORYME|nr:hypothetical protein FQA47_004798 [Oryzias melastigma]
MKDSRSFQPAPRQPQSFQGGWEVLKGVKQRWNGELISSSSYMSDCSQWTGYSWSNCAFSPYARVATTLLLNESSGFVLTLIQTCSRGNEVDVGSLTFHITFGLPLSSKSAAAF